MPFVKTPLAEKVQLFISEEGKPANFGTHFWHTVHSQSRVLHSSLLIRLNNGVQNERMFMSMSNEYELWVNRNKVQLDENLWQKWQMETFQAQFSVIFLKISSTIYR